MKRYIRSNIATNEDILVRYMNSYPELDITVDDNGIEVYNTSNDTTCSQDFYVSYKDIPSKEFERILQRCVDTVID